MVQYPMYDKDSEGKSTVPEPFRENDVCWKLFMGKI